MAEVKPNILVMLSNKNICELFKVIHWKEQTRID